jgi:hypothetical protein
MDEEALNRFEVHRAPNGKFYITVSVASAARGIRY